MGLAVSQSVSRSVVVVLSLVPVAGSHLSELIMCDKTGRRKKAASTDIIRDETTIFALLLIPPPPYLPISLSPSPYNCYLCRKKSGQIHF